MKVAAYYAGLLIVVLSAAVSVAAQPTAPVPEIDGGSIVSGLGLLSGSILMLKARWRS